MNILEIKNRFEVTNHDLTFESLLTDYPELSEELDGKSVIILPSHGSDDSFYAGSLDTLDYLNDNGVVTDIYATDEDYKELGLHGADIWLGTFFIKNFVIPIFCSVVAAYVYDKLKAKKDDKISLQFIVENKDGKSTSVSYEGKVENLEQAINAVKEVDSEVDHK
ncbi:TPA: hypothetical protein GRI54_24235 [Vibrio parahaemolyticus]|uniref:hypothetical protein n=1 Tax=Vibrio parahaemolyticus TaxID=670 RepID=UPI00063ECF08|nr:hypothetical protein [Vibrio parahaemolyticus]KLI82923.1 hypothetical protein AAY62_22150 [Vibrio parahaemolyticus]HAS6550790.1 hypothetical protein [Vibrio parahaemolyticus]HAS6736507.1 hypothetical protein [Vibrio parahaemolyticus]HAS6849235.1 hypothetical protein [Vibrio parahaemolyticus]